MHLKAMCTLGISGRKPQFLPLDSGADVRDTDWKNGSPIAQGGDYSMPSCSPYRVIVDSTLCVESLNFTEYILYAYIYGYTISSDRCTYTYMYLAY